MLQALRLKATFAGSHHVTWNCQVDLSNLMANVNHFTHLVEEELRVLARDQLYLTVPNMVNMNVMLECQEKVSSFTKSIPVNNLEKIGKEIDTCAHLMGREIAREIVFTFACYQAAYNFNIV